MAPGEITTFVLSMLQSRMTFSKDVLEPRRPRDPGC